MKYTKSEDQYNRVEGGEPSFEEKVLEIKRVSKKKKGGNSLAFTALVAVGDRAGRVGVGLGKAKDVRSAIEKGAKKAKQGVVTVSLSGATIPHSFRIKKGASHLILRPAPSGSGVMAGGALRTLVELVGIRDISVKSVGSRNKLSTVYAALAAFSRLTPYNREGNNV